MRELQTSMALVRLHHSLTAVALAIAIGMFLVLSLYAVRQQMSLLWPSLPIPVAAACARRYRRIRQSGFRMRRLKSFYNRAVERVQGNWARSGVTGEEFNDPGHVYATDLHIFGEGSLFELLCISRTSVGRRGLANYLLEAPVLEETLLRQEAVRELRDRADVRERIATLGESEFLESKWATFEDWLNSPALSFARPLPILAVFTSALLAGIVLAALLGLIPWIKAATWIAPLVVFHSVIGLVFRSRVNTMHAWVRPVSHETQVLREGLQFLEGEPFRSTKLRRLADQVRNGSESVRKLERLLHALNERHKDWFYGLSLVMLAGTQLCMAIEQWRREHGDSLKMWLGAWAEFEALNALAAYAYENPAHTFPEFSSGEACFEAESLGHPLLPRASCVVNHIALNRTSRFYMVSGSNMSGQSTLLRAIGLHAVLAVAGAPVRAGALRLSRL